MHTIKWFILFQLFLIAGLQELQAQSVFKNLEIADRKIKSAYSLKILAVPSAKTLSAAVTTERASCFRYLVLK